jgi:hypothetical protein
MGISLIDMCFIMKNMGMVERHIRVDLRDQLLMSLKLTIIGS